MNTRRIAGLFRQLGSLHMEIAAAIEHVEPKRKRRKHVAAPEVEVSAEAKDAARRALRKAGVAA